MRVRPLYQIRYITECFVLSLDRRILVRYFSLVSGLGQEESRNYEVHDTLPPHVVGIVTGPG
jgi:hypothetical protein